MDLKLETSKKGSIVVQFLQFSGGERHVQIDGFSDLKSEDAVAVRAYIRSSNDIMDYLLFENALLKINPAVQIDLELPYLPYARQDRVCSQGQAFSLEVFASLIGIHKKRSVTVWDCHSEVGLNLIGAKNITIEKIISHSVELMKELESPNSVIVCPDKGALNRSFLVAKSVGAKDIVVCEKTRDPATGRISEIVVRAKDLKGKRAIILDDICDGGMTFLSVAKALKEINCEEVILYVTHGIFSKGLSVFDGLIDRIYTTDSFSQIKNSKLNIINL